MLQASCDVERAVVFKLGVTFEVEGCLLAAFVCVGQHVARSLDQFYGDALAALHINSSTTVGVCQTESGQLQRQLVVAVYG